MGISYRVGKPSGIDNLFLLASEKPIQNPELIFNQEPVLTGVTSRGKESEKKEDPNPLSSLLDLGNSAETGSRGDRTPHQLTGNWVLKKYAVKCTY